QEYMELAQRCLNSMQEVQPLSSESDDRLTYKDFSSSNYQIKQDSV
ncbi:gamma carbonic anhydrase family protein, partial [Acinetobacter baumannii]